MEQPIIDVKHLSKDFVESFNHSGNYSGDTYISKS